MKKTNRILKLSKVGSKRSILTATVISKIENLVSFNLKLTPKETKRDLENIHDEDFKISISTINRCLKELKITIKLRHRKLDQVNSHDKIQQRKAYAIWFNNHFNYTAFHEQYL